MDKVQAGRLLTLAHFLGTEVSPKHFNMSSIADCDVGSKVDLHEPKCGTTACALGWATVVFPDQMSLCVDGTLHFDGHHTFIDGCAIQSFFGLNQFECEDLFDGVELRTPKQEAREIENVVKSHGWTYA